MFFIFGVFFLVVVDMWATTSSVRGRQQQKENWGSKMCTTFSSYYFDMLKFPGKREEKERMTRFYGLFHSGNEERDIRIRARTISTSGRRNVVHFRTLS